MTKPRNVDPVLFDLADNLGSIFRGIEQLSNYYASLIVEADRITNNLIKKLEQHSNKKGITLYTDPKVLGENRDEDPMAEYDDGWGTEVIAITKRDHKGIITLGYGIYGDLGLAPANLTGKEDKLFDISPNGMSFYMGLKIINNKDAADKFIKAWENNDDNDIYLDDDFLYLYLQPINRQFKIGTCDKLLAEWKESYAKSPAEMISYYLHKVFIASIDKFKTEDFIGALE